MSMRARAATSVVIPARNAEESLAQALESVRAQTDADWEAIIVHHRSTDQTGAIAGNFASCLRDFARSLKGARG